MVVTATGNRAAKRRETANRLQRCALRLTADRGYDGWTIDDLAEEADVSRRTVFNYFDGKADVVLGPMPVVDDERDAVFVAGGPTGDLVDDLLVLAADVIDEMDDPEAVAAGRAAVLGDPKLFRMVHERFETITEQFVDLVLRREGKEYGADRAHLLLRLVVAVFDVALERLADDPGRPFPDLFAACVDDARAVLTR